MKKIDSLRQEIRKAEKFKREMETRLEEANAETLKEKKLRERNEEFIQKVRIPSVHSLVRNGKTNNACDMTVYLRIMYYLAVI